MPAAKQNNNFARYSREYMERFEIFDFGVKTRAEDVPQEVPQEVHDKFKEFKELHDKMLKNDLREVLLIETDRFGESEPKSRVFTIPYQRVKWLASTLEELAPPISEYAEPDGRFDHLRNLTKDNEDKYRLVVKALRSMSQPVRDDNKEKVFNRCDVIIRFYTPPSKDLNILTYKQHIISNSRNVLNTRNTIHFLDWSVNQLFERDDVYKNTIVTDSIRAQFTEKPFEKVSISLNEEAWPIPSIIDRPGPYPDDSKTTYQFVTFNLSHQDDAPCRTIKFVDHPLNFKQCLDVIAAYMSLPLTKAYEVHTSMSAQEPSSTHGRTGALTRAALYPKDFIVVGICFGKTLGDLKGITVIFE